MLAFADDLVLIAPSPLELQLLMNCFVKFCDKNDLDINIGKTKAMFINCNEQIYVRKLKIETVQKFKYLGLYISNTQIKPDILIEARLSAAKRVFNAV